MSWPLVAYEIAHVKYQNETTKYRNEVLHGFAFNLYALIKCVF